MAEWSVQSGHLAPGAVQAVHIGAETITFDHLQDGCISGRKLALQSVQGEHIADLAVESRHLADGAIGKQHLQVGAVSNSALQDESVTEEKLALECIASRHLKKGAVLGYHLAKKTINRTHLSFNPPNLPTTKGEVLQQFGLLPFVLEPGVKSVDVTLAFDTGYKHTGYTLVATADQPGCTVSISNKGQTEAVLTIIRNHGTDAELELNGVLNWIAMG